LAKICGRESVDGPTDIMKYLMSFDKLVSKLCICYIVALVGVPVWFRNVSASCVFQLTAQVRPSGRCEFIV